MICFYEAGPLPAKDFVIFADSGLEDEKNKNTPCIRACMLLQDVFDMIFQLKLIFYIRRGGLISLMDLPAHCPDIACVADGGLNGGLQGAVMSAMAKDGVLGLLTAWDAA